MAHIYLKNVPENLCIPLLSGNGTQLPCTKYFKSYEVVYTSCDQLTDGQISPPLTPKPFKRKINFNDPLRREISKFKKGVEVWSMVPGQVLSKGGGGGWGACNFSR